MQAASSTKSSFVYAKLCLVDCCSNQAAREYDGGRQIFATPPAWTLKGRIYDNEIAKSPGPVYDANRGYTYLEQVHVVDTATCTCLKQQRRVHGNLPTHTIS